MENSLEKLSDPELSHLAYDLKDKYQLIINNVRVDVLYVIERLYDIDMATQSYARQALVGWLYQIADEQEYKDPEEGKLGFDYPNKDGKTH